jgi:hypothetical protein
LTEIKFGIFEINSMLNKQGLSLKLAYVLQNFSKIGV